MSQAEPVEEEAYSSKRKRKEEKKKDESETFSICTDVFSPKDRVPNACHWRMRRGEWMIMQPKASFDTQLHLEHLLWQAYHEFAQFVLPLCTFLLPHLCSLAYLGTDIKNKRGRPTGVVYLKAEHVFHIFPSFSASKATTVYVPFAVADGHFMLNIKTHHHQREREPRYIRINVCI